MANARQVFIDFQDGSGFIDITSYVKYGTFSITHRGFNDVYKYAQNECSFDVIYDASIFSSLATMSKDLIVRVLDIQEGASISAEDDRIIITESSIELAIESSVAVPVFYGHVPATRARTYNGLLDNTIFEFSAVDELDYFNTPVGDIVYTNCAVLDPANPSASIVHLLAAIAGWDGVNDIDPFYTISTIIPKFAPNSEDDTVLEVLNTLLYEYGFTMNLNSDNQVAPVRWLIPTDAITTIDFDDTNIIKEISLSDNIRQYDGVNLTYYEMGMAEKVRLFTDNNCRYDDTGAFSGYAILDGYTYPPETNFTDVVTGQKQVVFQEYTDDAITYKTNYAVVNNLDFSYRAFDSDFSAIVATANHFVDRKFDAGLDITTEIFLNKKCRLVYTNASGSTKNLYYNDVYGDIWFKSAERNVTVSEIANPSREFKYTMNFVYTQALTNVFAQALMAQFSEGSTAYKFKSMYEASVGNIARLHLSDGTDRMVMVQSREWDERQGMYTYKCVACSTNRGTLTSQNVYSGVKIDQTVYTSAVSTKTINVPYTGSIGNFSEAYTDISISRDGKDDTENWSLSVAGSHVSWSISNNRVSITAMSASTGTLVITASKTNWADIVHTVDVVGTVDTYTEEIIPSVTPKYLGKYLDSAPASPNTGDWYTRYSATAGDVNRGVFYYSGSAWVRTTDSRYVGSGAINDILTVTANVTYGTVSDYGATYISDLFSRFIKILAGGSIYGGDRFDSAGTEVDTTKDGFYLGADGTLRATLQSLFRQNLIAGTGSGLSILNSGTGSNQNTIYGTLSGTGITTSYLNTLMGFQAGKIITGAANTCIGANAGLVRSSGDRNVEIGFAANVTGTGGDDNVYIGYMSGGGESHSGNANVAVGEYVRVGTTVAGSTAIGAFSTIMYNNCSALGYGAGHTGPNQVQLGNPLTHAYAYGPVVDKASDRRDKADIRPTSFGLDFINKLKPVEYRYNYREDYIIHNTDGTIVELPNDGSKTRKRFHQGMIAQDVKEIIDEMGVDFAGYIDFSVDGGVKDRLTLSYGEFITPIIRAVQELSAEVDKLKERLNGKTN
jgi:hypothetical protein